MSRDLATIRECKGCVWHGLGYREWHEDADQREKRGERQLQCSVCGRWCWREHLLLPARSGENAPSAPQSKSSRAKRKAGRGPGVEP